MNFSLSGKIDENGRFIVQGITGLTAVSSYELTVEDMTLAPFREYFSRHGLDTDNTTTGWLQQVPVTDEDGTGRTAMRIKGIRPLDPSDLSLVLALLTGPEGDMQFTWSPEQATEDSLLFESLVSHLQHQTLRTAVSPFIILQESLPELDLVPTIDFPPGSAVLPDPAVLGGFDELLRLRPFLQLRLKAYIEDDDRQALLGILQEEADRLREEENLRRAQKKAELAEQEVQRLKEMGQNEKVEEEVLETGELDPDLEPLPPEQVEVDPEMLVLLAHRRLQAVRSYLTEDLGVDPARISQDETPGQGGSRVIITLEPRFDDIKVQEWKAD